MVTLWTQRRGFHSLYSGASFTMISCADHQVTSKFPGKNLPQDVTLESSPPLDYYWTRESLVECVMWGKCKVWDGNHNKNSSVCSPGPKPGPPVLTEVHLATEREGKRSCEFKKPSFQNIIQIHAKNPAVSVLWLSETYLVIPLPPFLVVERSKHDICSHLPTIFLLNSNCCFSTWENPSHLIENCTQQTIH